MMITTTTRYDNNPYAKSRWWLSATKSSNDGKEYLAISLSSKPTQRQIRRIKKELKIGKSTVFVANKFL
ncbi:hypothetical protein KW882_02185 [Vibrio parahaemolyticus]